MHNYSELKKYNKKELLVMLMILQKAFFGYGYSTNFARVRANFCFLIIKLYIILQILSRILLYELTERYEYRDIRTFRDGERCL